MQASITLPGSGDTSRLGVDRDGRWTEGAVSGPPDIGRGWYALPGLVDAHVHLAADELDLAPGDPAEIRRRAFACLDGGVFLVVDKGWGDDSVVMALQGHHPDEVPDWEAAGRMITVPGGYYHGFAIETDPAGLADVVAGAAAGGRGWVKLVGDWPRRGRGAVANFDEAALRLAVDIAHGAGARVAIHTMAPDVPTMAVRAGVDSIEHGLFLTPSDLGALAGRGGAWVPTVARMEATAEALGADSSGGRLIREGLENVTGLLAQAPDGVAILAGTDLAMPPSAIGREVVRLAESGLDAERAVASVSTAARRYLGRSDGFGVGDPADAVFFERDPVADLSVLATPCAVMRNGVVR